MQQPLLLSVIIVSYNTQELTLQAVTSVVESISKSERLKDHSQVIVVDNHSQDKTVVTLKEFWLKKHQELSLEEPVLKIITAEQNLGFGKANNLGIEIAQADKSEYILFLNSDTVVIGDALEKLVQAFEEHPVDEKTAGLASQRGRLDRLGILAATLLNSDQTPQTQGGSTPTLLSLFTTLFFLDDLPLIGRMLPAVQHTGKNQRQLKFKNSAQKKLIQQDWVGGTAMMVRSSMLSEIGNFDQNIFMYGEDVELCVRAKNHHWDVAICPSVQVIHHGSASSSSANAILGEYQGYIYIWAKHNPAWQMPILKGFLQLSAVLRQLIFGTILGNRQKAEVYARARQNMLR